MITEKEIEQAAAKFYPYDESNKHNGPIHWEKHTNKIDKYRSSFTTGANFVLKDMDSEMCLFAEWIFSECETSTGQFPHNEMGFWHKETQKYYQTFSELLQIYKNRAK